MDSSESESLATLLKVGSAVVEEDEREGLEGRREAKEGGGRG